MYQVSVVRAAILVACAALLDAVLGPYLTVGSISPNLTVFSIVVAATGLEELQGILLGFFGGVLLDALGDWPFGLGSLGGLLAGAIAVRAGTAQYKGASRLMLAQVVALAVAVYDLVSFAANGLAGFAGPSLLGYVLSGVVPDALLHGALAYAFGEALMRLLLVRGDR